MTGIDPSGSEDAPPEVAGFDALELVGAGGFSTVWAATEAAFGRRVALKVIDAAGGQARRLEREARALGRLSGIPHVVEPFSIVSAADGRLVLVMPLLVGSLADRVREQGPLGPDVLRWAMPVARALDAAHRRGVAHRDLKPENILFSEEGEPFLADFGIAVMEGMATATVTALSLSPVHAPPERFGVDEVDPMRGDLWSFASTVCTAMWGTPPFGTAAEGGLVGLMNRICSAPPSRPAAMGDQVFQILERALAKDPADRYSDAMSFVADLEEAARVEGGSSGARSAEAPPENVPLPAVPPEPTIARTVPPPSEPSLPVPDMVTSAYLLDGLARAADELAQGRFEPAVVLGMIDATDEVESFASPSDVQRSDWARLVDVARSVRRCLEDDDMDAPDADGRLMAAAGAVVEAVRVIDRSLDPDEPR